MCRKRNYIASSYLDSERRYLRSLAKASGSLAAPRPPTRDSDLC